MSRRLPGQIVIWEPATGRKTQTLAELPVGFRCAVFSPNGRHIASDWENTVKLWDAETGCELATLSGHQAAITCVAWSPDGTHVVSASEDQTVRVWQLGDDWQRGRVEVFPLPRHPGPVAGVAFSPDGRRLASAGRDGVIRIWDGNTRSELHRLDGHVGAVTAVVFSPNGLRLASGGDDQTVRVWDITTGQEVWSLPDAPPNNDVQRGPLAFGASGGKTPIMDIAFSPDGQRLASVNLHGSVRLWDVATGQEAISLRRHFARGSSVAFSPDGRYLVAGDFEGSLIIWDAGDNEPKAHGVLETSLQGK
jgi:WD40 repeat protein